MHSSTLRERGVSNRLVRLVGPIDSSPGWTMPYLGSLCTDPKHKGAVGHLARPGVDWHGSLRILWSIKGQA